MTRQQMGCDCMNNDNVKLQIEYVPIESISPYKRNAKQHPEEQIEQIRRSIIENGFRDPIAIWHNEIVEGHGRYIAARQLGMTYIPVMRLDDMTDEQRRKYGIIHNQTTINSGFDLGILAIELDELPDFDFDFYGVDIGGELTGALELAEADVTDVHNQKQCQCPKCGFVFAP